MAFTLALPSVASLLRSLYPMKITEKGNKLNMLPCDIMELNEVRQFETPSFPLDDGSNISDTIYTLPRVISARVYVNTNDYDTFKQKLESLQYGDGFDIYGVDSQLYESFRLTDVSEPQTSDVASAYIINLTFKETILVGAFSSAIIKKASKGAYSGNVNKGNAGTQKMQSALFKIIN